MENVVITRIDCKNNNQLFNKTIGELEGKLYLMRRRYRGYLERNRLQFPVIYKHQHYNCVFDIVPLNSVYSDEMKTDINNMLNDISINVEKALNRKVG